MNDIHSLSHSKWNCKYHIVFAPKYRRKVFYGEKNTQRAECSCVLGTDIGAYDTCAHLCRYCYANISGENVRRNIRLHDPNSPFLVGTLHEGETIHQAEQLRLIFVLKHRTLLTFTD